MDKYVICPILYFAYFFVYIFHTRDEVADQKLYWRSPFPTGQLSSTSVLRVFCSKQNESQDCSMEVSCDWLRWYFTERKLLSKMTTVLFFVVWKLCSVVPLFSPPPHPPFSAVQRQASSPTDGGGRGWEEQGAVENLFVFTVRERERERESKRERERSMLFPPTPPRPILIGEQEERGGARSTDQGWSVYVLISDQEQWVGPAPPHPYTYPSPSPSLLQSHQPISEQQDL